MSSRMRCLAVIGCAVCLLAVPATADAAAKGTVISIKEVTVASPDNPSVGIVPFKDAIYKSCAEAPQAQPPCQLVGGVKYGYGIGQLEITVGQWVKFLNAVDPSGANRHGLYDPSESASGWPKYGQIDFAAQAPKGSHYSASYPEWTDKPYGFANFLRAARFVNSLDNGKLLSRKASASGPFKYVTYRVQLSKQTERGMYDLAREKRTGATRALHQGFVVPSQDEWIKAAYYDPNGGGTDSYWKYPTNPGVFGDGSATAPGATTLDATTGNVTNAGTQPLADYRPGSGSVPSWCPATISAEACAGVNPFGIDPLTYATLYQGSLETVGQAKTTSPWGTLDQGGNAVEWTDTITPPPTGRSGGRVWRRLHGGIANAPAYQLWLSAVGLQPQDNAFYTTTYPWLGFRVGVIGFLKPVAARKPHKKH